MFGRREADGPAWHCRSCACLNHRAVCAIAQCSTSPVRPLAVLSVMQPGHNSRAPSHSARRVPRSKDATGLPVLTTLFCSSCRTIVYGSRAVACDAIVLFAVYCSWLVGSIPPNAEPHPPMPSNCGAPDFTIVGCYLSAGYPSLTTNLASMTANRPVYHLSTCNRLLQQIDGTLLSNIRFYRSDFWISVDLEISVHQSLDDMHTRYMVHI